MSLLVLAPAASAAPKIVDRIVAGDVATGTVQGKFNNARGVAINWPGVADATADPLGASTDGYVYVVDEDNNRVQVFGPDNAFKFTFGRGVHTGGDGFQICDSTEVPCQGSTAVDDEFGEFDDPQGIAINQSNGNVYVRDRDNLRVQVFEADGDFIRAFGQEVVSSGPGNVGGFEICVLADGDVCKKGSTGITGGAFASNSTASTGIAVMPAGAANAGNVFVVDPGQRRLQEFTAAGEFVRLWGWDVVSAGPGNTGTSFEVCVRADGDTCKGANTSSGSDNGRWGSNQPVHVAADAVTGTVYVSDAVTQVSPLPSPDHRVLVFDSDAAIPADLLRPRLDVAGITNTPNAGGGLNATTALAVDPGNGNLLVSRSNGSTGVLEIAGPATVTPTHADTHVANTEELVSGRGLAVNPTTDDLYIATATSLPGHRLYAADDDGAPPASSEVTAITDVDTDSANLEGTVNPSGGTLTTSYRFEYSPDGVVWTPAAAYADVGNGVADIPVQAAISGLEPNTFYRVRIATRKQFENPEYYSPLLNFVTAAAPPDAVTRPVGPRTETSADLYGTVDPNGSATNYWFEYGGDTNYGAKIPLTPAPAGSGNEPLFLIQHLSGLQPNTTYHYRIVADGFGPAVNGADQSFTTRSAEAAKPDLGARAFELVSPPDKVGGIGVGPIYGGSAAASYAGFAAYEGERFAAMGDFGSMLLGDSAQAFANDWAFAQRAGDSVGWVSHSPITHASVFRQWYRWANVQAATPDLSRVAWRGNAGLLFAFPGMVGWVDMNSSFLGDWDGRWEIFGPTDPDAQVKSAGNSVANTEVALSADGTTAAGSTSDLRGLAGPGDPTLSLPSASYIRNVYVADSSGPLADNLPDTGARVLASVCATATSVPAVSVGGDLSSQACADGDLTSPLGATLMRNIPISASVSTSLRNVISDDGSRVFFMSPDPEALGVPTGTGSSFCDSPGEACPPQLYVRQRQPNDDIVVRWISRSRSVDLGDGRYGGVPIAGQDATLLGQALYEGASADGDKVFFRTNSPLTPDDPNGGAPLPGGVTTGNASSNSWDLYMYDFPDAPGADPGDGTLTRVSAGPTGASDANNPQGSIFGEGQLRFASEDGTRAYFVTAASLAGVTPGADGTITLPGGDSTTSNQSNLYAYDAAAPLAERWHFVARLPSDGPGGCATTYTNGASPLSAASPASTDLVGFFRQQSCVKGTTDGRFITFWTPGRLSAGDPDNSSADIYAYDASRDELTRITAPQGGAAGGSYLCGTSGNAATTSCFGDPGFDTSEAIHRTPNPPLGLASDPANPGDRIAFFQSRSRLVSQDTDDAYDVYQWRNGKLSLLTPGDSPPDEGQMYKGNDVSGKNVYFATLDQFSWQDFDAVLDVYTARIGGGIPQPVVPPACSVLADACQGAAAGAPAPSGASSAVFAGAGNVVERQDKPRRARANRCAKKKGKAKKRCLAKQKKQQRAKRAANHDRRASR